MTALPKFPTVQEWFTARELAELNLQTLPRSESAVIRVAKRNEWQSTHLARERRGRGGGWEYHFELLSEGDRAELIKRAELTTISQQKNANAGDVCNEDGNIEPLKSRQSQMMQARAALLIEVEGI